MAKIEKGIIIQSSLKLLVWRGDLQILPFKTCKTFFLRLCNRTSIERFINY